ncbi:hypothetical protein N7462_008729 [Penicillium macrosclerotiorum]|uniref:uncharacterized protein n=1 Tax=Penicillium macrosclerotiorum TaxID=303699 RepID=UPI0025473F63|nr:uncharacterized protein N7462_008729 [Penicillium macrosclerotiorum]KAJ5675832.1 hypothetical protein N7462_008729 [Penicillium macrosclerotiorum]
MEDPQLAWNDTTNLLQGIMVRHDGSHLPDPSDFRSGSLTLGDAGPNPLFDLDLTSFDPAQGHSTILGPWRSTTDQQDFYPNYYPSRLAGEQDAWNPLQVTGVPTSTAGPHIPGPSVGDREFGYSKPHYRTPSESGSQYMGSLHSADSGYGSASCGAHSVIASYVDSSSPQIASKEHSLGESLAMFDQAQLGPSMFARDFAESPLESVRCDHPACTWVGKCPSDKRKHEARHRKLFKCNEPNCPRKEGFGTINDLARHKKCVHNKEPERGPKMMYLCFGMNCPRPDKKWPRLDNFKQHLSRMHHEEDADALLKKSMDWYERVIGQTGQKVDDSVSLDESLVDTQQDLVSIHEMDLDSVDSVLHPQDPVEMPSPKASTPTSIQHNTHSEIPTLRSLSALSNTGPEPAIEQGSAKSETFVTDAAENLVNAMTRMVNNHARRSSQQSDEGIDLELENSRLSQPQRQMLQRILSAALERLSDETPAAPELSDDKQDWFQCDICSKRTRLRCEMKKHQKRHERPYGCTFPHCAKSFGSKADWKRHESSQHLHIQSWLCPFQDSQKDTPCERIFYREDTFSQHLSQHHRLSKSRSKAALPPSRLDLADRPHFWCGFCTRNVPLRNHGSAALDERFNHIDVEHFKKGQRGREWAFPSEVTLDRVAREGPGALSRSDAGDGLSQTPDKNNKKRKFSE